MTSKTTASVQYSYPFDHHDPRIQNSVDRNEELWEVFRPFASLFPCAKNLRQLGDSLAPKKKEIKDAKAVIHQIREALGKCDTVSVDRICVSGSIGKQTSLASRFDIDLVVFVNNASPPFSSLLEEWEERLPKLLSASLEMQKTTRFSLQFLFEGFNIDLLPAENLLESKPKAFETAADLQRKALVNKLHTMSVRDRRYWFAGFSEATVDYIKQQSSFCNAAIRICKFWKQNCKVTFITFPSWFTSFLVELVASELAQKELSRHPSDASILRVLREFLGVLSKPQKLKIIPSKRTYKLEDVPKEILRARPMVLDPVNPFNNVASNLQDWVTIQQLARSTIESLDEGATMSSVFSPRLGSDMAKLFEWTRFALRGIVHNNSYVRSLRIHQVRELKGRYGNVGVEWRKNDLHPTHFPSAAKDRIMEMLESLVLVATNAMQYSSNVPLAGQDGTSEVRKVSDFVDDMLSHVFDTPEQDWVPITTDLHNERDVTLTFGQIPLPSQPDDLRYIQLKLSFNFLEISLYQRSYHILKHLEHQKDPDDDESYY